MTTPYINVIDEDFDVTLDLTAILNLQTQYDKIKNDNKHDRIHNYTYDKTKSIDFNHKKIEQLSRKLSRKLQLNTTPVKVEANTRAGFRIPAYSPPSSKDILMFQLQVTSYNNLLTPSPIFTQAVPKMPQLPQAKTNTNLANYIHKLYIYKQYIKEQLKINELNNSKHHLQSKVNTSLPISAGTTIDNLKMKMNYNENLSKQLAQNLSRQSGRSVQI